LRSDAESKRQLIRRSAQLELNAQIEEAKVKQGQRDDKLEALSNALKVEDERAAWLQRVADEFRSRAEAVKPTSCMAHGAAACMRPGPCPWTGSPRPSASGAEVATPNFAECGGTKSSARLVHPCDETAVAVLLGTPKLSPPPCFLAREISAPTAP